jgi:predicted ArsR family transcriptional regulator
MADPARVRYACACAACRQSPRGRVAEQHRSINRLAATLDERRRRLFVGLLASRHGHGGVVRLAEITGLSRTTIRRGIVELQEGVPDLRRRIRQRGGGRPRLEKKTRDS